VLKPTLGQTKPVPDVPIVQPLRSVQHRISPFQSFQTFNRFAPFKSSKKLRLGRDFEAATPLNRWDFKDQDFLTPPHGVLFLAHTIKILISQSGICRVSLETGCTDVETQAHARVLGL
jgi:hypothetical protein